jgi:hypothetical protein
MPIDPGATASRCLTAWTSGHPEDSRPLLSEDVVFEGPLGRTQGADAYVRGVRQMADSVRGVDVERLIVDGDDVCIVYALQSSAGPLPTVSWYHFRDDKIDAVRAYFDPRPLVESQTATARPATRRATSKPDIPLFAAGLQLCDSAG